jgi:hypothetical protein
VDPRAGLDDLKKRKFLILTGLELRSTTRWDVSAQLHTPGEEPPYPLYKKLFKLFIITAVRTSNPASSPTPIA